MTFDAGTLTEIVLAAGALAAAYVVPTVLARRASSADGERDAADRERDKERDTVSSWAELNEALQAEIRRATGELARQRDDYQRELSALRADYQAQLDAAKRRITELEAEVATLQRALQGRGP